jgi:serine/threonine-protein kinase
MAQPHADRNLLFGILALQLDFIGRDALVAAMNAWVLDKHRPLGQILVEQQALAAANREALELLVNRHLQHHSQQPQSSLAVVSIPPEVRRDLDGLADADLHASLAGIPSTIPPHGSGVYLAGVSTERLGSTVTSVAVGEASSSGLRFRVLRPHAEGGLGKVLVARDGELNRDVALKEIKPEYAENGQARARFLAEAEITGGLEHPGIVPVYGLGTYPDGRPFYAMRFIHGDSLLEAIERFHRTDGKSQKAGERALALRGLLRRFVDVCNAVAYAHSRGVIHRDLKPANVMLGPYGETLLVDWGLAKPLPAEAGTMSPPEGFLWPSSGEGVRTQAGAVVGTPGYMAPEQASGGAVGSPADVYSLGVMLYHLLAGTVPFGGSEVGDVLRRVAQGQHRPAREVNPAVPPALSAICHKAMALEPAQRYGMAKELAADVERWLADEPVSAYREPWAARLARWGRHHRPLVASASALLLTAVVALALGIVAVNREKKRTEGALAAESQARKHARAALDEMSSQVIEDWLARQAKVEPAQRAFLEKALAYYETFAEESAQSEEVRKGVADAHLRVGKIRQHLGHHKEAEAAYRRAQQLHASLVADFSATPQYRLQLASSHRNLGLLLSDMGRPKEAEAAYSDALALLKPLAADFPAVLGYRLELSQGYNNLANLLKTTGHAPDAEAAYRAALDIDRRLVADYPAVPQYRLEVAQTHNNLANLLARMGHTQEAKAAYTDALALYKSLVAEYPAVPEYRMEQARSHNNLGTLLNTMGRTKEAETTYRDALALQKLLVADFPAVPEYRQQLAMSYTNLANLLRDTGRKPDAEAGYREAFAIFGRLATEFPHQASYQFELGNTMDELAEVLRGRKDYSSARQLLEQARSPLQAALDANPRHPFYRAAFCENRQRLAATLLDLGEHATAAGAAADLARIAVEPANDAYKAACFFARCMALAEQENKLSDARRKQLTQSYGERAVAVLRQALANGYKDIAHLQKDKDLDALRPRDDFQKLLADLEKETGKEKPKDNPPAK